MPNSPAGLRELKKQMTRETIADAAMSLALEKGLDHATIDDIAQLAFVSPRTVSNYFSSKEEAVVVAGTLDWLSVIEEFGEVRPSAERPLAALCEALSDFASSCDEEQLNRSLQLIDLVAHNPALRPYQTAEYDKLEEALRSRVAERTGTDTNTDMYPWLVAAAAVSAVRSAVRLWAHSSGPDRELAVLIREAFNQISGGLPVPYLV